MFAALSNFFTRADSDCHHDQAPLSSTDRVVEFRGDWYAEYQEMECSAKEAAIEHLGPGGGFVFDEAGNVCAFVAPYPG